MAADDHHAIGGARLLNLIPKIYYTRLADGLAFFVDGLGFSILHQDSSMAVVARGGAKAYLVQSPVGAAAERPDLGVDTDDIEALYAEMSKRAPQLLHPQCSTVKQQPWGSREFAMLDATTVCVTFRQWRYRD